MRKVALASSLMTGAVLVVDSPAGRSYFLFSYAVQSPTEGGFQTLDAVAGLPLDLPSVLGGEKTEHAWTFKARWGGFVYNDHFATVDEDACSLVMHVYQTSDGYCFSDVRRLVSFANFWEAAQHELGLGEVGDMEDDASSASDADVSDHSEAAYDSGSDVVDSSDSGPEAALQPLVPRAVRHWDERRMAAAYDSAAALRAAWARDLREYQQVDFSVRPVCGEGAVKKYNRLCEGLRGLVATVEGREFTDEYQPRLQTTITFSTELYTLNLCRAFALEWCHRMQFFKDVWSEAGHDNELCRIADWRLGEYVETDAFAAFAANADLPHIAAARVRQIREIQPS